MKTFNQFIGSFFTVTAIIGSSVSCSQLFTDNSTQSSYDSVSSIDTSYISAYNFDVDTSNNGNIDTIPTHSHPTRKYYDAINFNLKGHVKEVREIYEDSTSYTKEEFNPDGSLVVSGEADVIVRDENNRITEIIGDHTTISKNYNGQIYAKISYTGSRVFTWKNGLVVADEENWEYIEENTSGSNTEQIGQVGHDLCYYEYNQDGLIVKSCWSNGGNNAEYYIYNYIKFDAHGNWTKRKAICSFNDTINSSIEERVISYYE